jgi:hypothetical protein
MNKRFNAQQEKVTGPSRFCHHVSAGRINAPKRCLANHECFHCAYDQWLDDIDLEKMHPGLMAGTLTRNLATAA